MINVQYLNKGTSFVPKTKKRHKKLSVFVSVGLELNSFYHEEDSCCVQFLYCLHCEKFRTEVEPLAAEIKLTGEFSKYQTGQVCKALSVLQLRTILSFCSKVIGAKRLA